MASHQRDQAQFMKQSRLLREEGGFENKRRDARGKAAAKAGNGDG